jgi:acetylornithine deacetylase/succinyl-diaminopimelate desuccinylase-like protein
MTPAAHNARITSLAAQRAVHQAFAWLHLHEPQLRRWQLEFLAIPAPTFAEADRAAWFAERFTQLGLANAHIDAAGNALAELPAANAVPEAPCVLLSAHLDTVFAAGTDCTPREEAAVILGPGATDNGAGLTALLGLAAALKAGALTPQTTILFAANVGEEGEGDLRGMRHLFSSQSPYHGRIRAAIALEGSGTATVVDRALGSRRLRISITGPGGHSWADAGRPNPIAALAAALLELERLPLPANPRTTLNIGVISGGTSINSIPELASADLDLRSTSAMELDRTELAILRTLSEAVTQRNNHVPAEWQMKLQAVRIGDRAAGALSRQSALFHSLQAVDRHLGIATDPHIGSTDANLPLSLGVPALAIGCGGTGAGIHTLAESYDPTGRDLALRRILLLLLDALDSGS